MGTDLENKNVDDSKNPGEGDKGNPGGRSSEQPGQKEFTPITSQEQLDAIIQPRVSRAKDTARNSLRKEVEDEVRKEYEAEASRKADEESGEWKKLYEASVSEVADLKKKLADRDVQDIKIRLLEENKLPASVAKRIFGETEDEIKADISDYLKDSGPVKTPDKEPPASTPGNSTQKEKTTTDASGRDLSKADTWGLPTMSSNS